MKHELFYTKPASRWEEALPLGNGHMGAMVYGDAECDVIKLNNDTLWSGKPHQDPIEDETAALSKIRELVKEGRKKEADELANEHFCRHFSAIYFPMGEIRLNYINYEIITDYNRRLDMSTATSDVFIKDIIGIEMHRRSFISYPHNVMVVDMDLKKPSHDTWHRCISYAIGTESLLDSKIKVEENIISVKGRAHCHHFPHLPGEIEFTYMIYVDTDGRIEKHGGGIGAYDAQRITLYIASETNYVDWDTTPDKNKDLYKICLDRITEARKLGVEKLHKEHIEDFQSLYNRVSLDLGDDDTQSVPTDERIKNYDPNDSGLSELLYNFGRYLMISSSRPGSQPTNLQGIWNHRCNPPWKSNYTININTEMNYWPVNMSNLTECHTPFLEMLKDLSISGQHTAKTLYGCRGFTVHHNTDVWRKTTPAKSYSGARCAFWPMGGLWLCQHLWHHYEYTLDKKFLKDFAYPIMKEACLFALDYMTFNGEYHVTSPSTSPENIFKCDNGDITCIDEISTMDLTLVKELFRNYKYMMDELGETDEILSEIDKIKLPPFKIGSDGRLLEYSMEYEEIEKGYRHLSHLYGLYPGDILFEEDKSIFEAAKKSLDYRLKYGSGYTGWSCGWIINLFSVLKQPEDAKKYIDTMFRQSTFPNMMDSHPPFQIDGNFGFVSGVTQMLMQSKKEKDTIIIDILPCLPKEWTCGSVKGILAKGNIELDIAWDNEKAKVKVNSKSGYKYKIVSSCDIEEI